MAITSDQKVDFLWKKIGYKAAKTDTSDNKGGPNEAIPATQRIDSQVIWAQSGDIPAVQPTASAGVVTVYSDAVGSSATVETTEDATATSQRTWKTGLTNWIDPSYGSTYLVKVYADDAGQSDPETGGTQLLGGEDGYEWFFDYDAGVLHFIGTSIPSALTGKKIYIKGSRYTGNTGVPAGGDSHNLAFDPSNLNDLHSTNTNGNINLDPNGTGNVVIEGTNSLVLPVGTTAQRDASPTQGGVRYNTTTSSFEGYSGSDWGSLGGLIDIDQDTYICAEVSSDADDLEFYTAGTKQLCIDQAGLITATSCIVGSSRIISDSTTDATNGTDGSIQTDGGISAAKAIFAGTTIDATTTLTAGGRIISDDTTDATSTTDGSIQTDGGISSAKAIFGGTTITATGRIISDDTTDATSGTDGSIQTDGGISSAKAIFSGTTITATGRILTDDTTNATSTTDGALQSDGGLSVACNGYFGGNIVIKDAGNIGSASDTDAIAIAANGNVTISQDLAVTGDLTISGTTTTVDSTTMTVVDPIIHLQTAVGGGALGSDTNKDVGLAMQYHTGSAPKTAFLGFDDSAGKLTFVPDATISSEVVSGSVGTLVANLEGDVTGDVTGNASTATTLETARTINGVSFNGSGDITVTAAAGTLTGATLNSSVTASSLTSVGTITSLRATSFGVGTAASGTTGEIRATNEITAYYSDRRLKVVEEKGPGQDVEGKDAADVLTEISGVYYKESDEAKLFGYDSDKRQVGLIAQDVQKILPEIVVPAPFDVAEDGSSKSGEDYLTIKYEKVIPLLVNAINAQTSKITELKQTVNLLEKDIQDLKKALNIE